MKKFLKIAFFAMIFAWVIMFPYWSLYFKYNDLKDRYDEYDTRINILEECMDEICDYFTNVDVNHPDSLFNKDWFLFKLALIKVESNFNQNAVNEITGAGGLYQIMPVEQNGFLREANRIIGYLEFDDSCRWNHERSNEIFEIVNLHHNPNKCIEKSILLHNPRAGNWYRDRILTEYNFLKSISKQLDK